MPPVVRENHFFVSFLRPSLPGRRHHLLLENNTRNIHFTFQNGSVFRHFESVSSRMFCVSLWREVTVFHSVTKKSQFESNLSLKDALNISTTKFQAADGLFLGVSARADSDFFMTRICDVSPCALLSFCPTVNGVQANVSSSSSGGEIGKSQITSF